MSVFFDKAALGSSERIASYTTHPARDMTPTVDQSVAPGTQVPISVYTLLRQCH